MALSEVAPDMKFISDDTPLRLSVAASLAFPDGSASVSTLRTEARNGNLAIETIAGKHYTTLNDIKAMREKCRENQKVRGSTGANRVQVALANGSSSTERLNAAQAAANLIAQKLKLHSKAT